MLLVFCGIHRLIFSWKRLSDTLAEQLYDSIKQMPAQLEQFNENDHLPRALHAVLRAKMILLK